jgi:pimeloyl-ACP methyl ester carboxylesterase
VHPKHREIHNISVTFKDRLSDQETTMSAATQTPARAADQSATAAMRGRQGVGVGDNPPVTVDYLEAGSFGPVVVLVHSSVSGARQWRRLMDDLKGDFRVRAVNLFGYAKTPPWPAARTQTLDDQARLVEAVMPTNADEVYLVGHSFGGSVAMKAAARLSGRVAKLVLLETNPFHFLAQSGRVDAFAEAMELRNFIKKFGALSEWATAAEKFADYWGGAGTWRDMSLDRRIAFSEALKPNYFEWDAVMNETTPLEQWATLLPRDTLLVCDPRTVLPIREIAALLHRSNPGWIYREVPGAGHMAPITHPELINPLVGSFLRSPADTERMIGLGRLQPPNQA